MSTVRGKSKVASQDTDGKHQEQGHSLEAARGQRLCSYLISRRKRHKSNSSGISTYKSIFTILLGTELICQLIQT